LAWSVDEHEVWSDSRYWLAGMSVGCSARKREKREREKEIKRKREKEIREKELE